MERLGTAAAEDGAVAVETVSGGFVAVVTVSRGSTGVFAMGGDSEDVAGGVSGS